MTSSAFWFFISSMYFPFVSNELIYKPAGIPEIIQRILERNINAPKNFSIKNKLRKKKILMDLVSLLDTNLIKRNEELMLNYIERNIPIKQTSIDNMITNASDKVDTMHNINQRRISNKIIDVISKSRNQNKESNQSSENFFLQNNFNLKILTDNSNENFNCKDYDRDDILIDMQFKSKFKKEFEDYIIKKHEEISENKKDVILSRLDEEKNHNPDDIVCLVCNDGDYEDNNLIVYCSKCQMTVHQQCYGIISIPDEDWLCYPCQFYDEDEKAKQIECILCPIKGGAMKPSNLKIKSSFWRDVMILRRDNYRNNYIYNGSINNGFSNSHSAPNLIREDQLEDLKADIKNKEEKKEPFNNNHSNSNQDLKNEIKMDITNSPKNISNSERFILNNQESIIKNISNRTITESNCDNLSVKYFSKEPDEEYNSYIEPEKNKENIQETIRVNMKEYKNGNLITNLQDENMENIPSTNDQNFNLIENKNSIENKIDKYYFDNSDNECCSSKELFEKTNAELFSNDSLNEKNGKSNIDFNLNLNESDNLNIINPDNNHNSNLNKSIKLEAEKTISENEKNKNTQINRRRGRQKKNIRNKKDLSKSKDESSNQAKIVNELVGTNSKKSYAENAWVHLSCALWIPDVLIEDFEKKENIKNIENIDKKRFNETCSICNWSGCGPTIKCENVDCKIRFHIECARINKYQMEIIDNSNGELKYYIFCRLHQPHRMIKNIELKRQNEINDIKAFRSLIQKCFDLLDINENISYINYSSSKLNKSKFINGELSQDDDNGVMLNKAKNRMEISSKERKEILNQIRNVAFDVVSGYCLVFKKQLVKKIESKNINENPENITLINDNDNFQQESIRWCEEKKEILEYKFMETNEHEEMEVDDENKKDPMLTRGIEIDFINKNSIQNIHETLLTEDKNNILRCELIKKDSNNFIEIPVNSQMQNNASSINLENQTNSSESKEPKNGITVEKLTEENIFHSIKDIIVNSGEDIQSPKNLVYDVNIENEQKVYIDQGNKINNSDHDFSQNKQIENKISNESYSDNMSAKSKIYVFDNEIASNVSNKALGLQNKTRDKKHIKEFIYKLQNNRILIGKSPFINFNPLSYNDSLNPNLFPWFYIKSGNMKPIDIVRFYKKYIKDDEMYHKNILRLSHSTNILSYSEANILNKKGKKKKLGSRIVNNSINVRAETLNCNQANTYNTDNQLNSDNYVTANSALSEILYCYCKKPTSSDLMIGCENDRSCPNNGWIHKECDEELKKLPQTIIEDENFKFYCKDCRIINNTNSKTKKGKKKSKKK